MTIGKHPDNDIVLTDDPSVSRHHALLERVGGRWSIRDLGSTNGVFVNGARIFGEHVVRSDDEIVIGRTLLRFSNRTSPSESSAADALRTRRLTPAEVQVLREVCRPLLSERGGEVAKPATVREIAERLSVSEDVVKRNLTSLCDRFEIEEDGSFESRYARLVKKLFGPGWDDDGGSGDREPRTPAPPSRGPVAVRPLCEN
jgi:pSer/pThr/pTyr-binding forkhead associated (FHA) protein